MVGAYRYGTGMRVVRTWGPLVRHPTLFWVHTLLRAVSEVCRFERGVVVLVLWADPHHKNMMPNLCAALSCRTIHPSLCML